MVVPQEARPIPVSPAPGETKLTTRSVEASREKECRNGKKPAVTHDLWRNQISTLFLAWKFMGPQFFDEFTRWLRRACQFFTHKHFFSFNHGIVGPLHEQTVQIETAKDLDLAKISGSKQQKVWNSWPLAILVKKVWRWNQENWRGKQQNRDPTKAIHGEFHSHAPFDGWSMADDSVRIPFPGGCSIYLFLLWNPAFCRDHHRRCVRKPKTEQIFPHSILLNSQFSIGK